MVASAALGELNRSDLCKGTRSCSIISVPRSAVTKRASGVSSGILVHQETQNKITIENNNLRYRQKQLGSGSGIGFSCSIVIKPYRAHRVFFGNRLSHQITTTDSGNAESTWL